MRMPYIKEEQRRELLNRSPKNAGELNYYLIMVIGSYIEEKGERYQTYNDIIGVLTCIQHELYRRNISTYEDEKIAENGDVFVMQGKARRR